jgi:hypothetical protein
VNELTGKKGGPIATAETRDNVREHLETLAKRFGEGLKVIEGGVPAKKDHLEGLNERFANKRGLNGEAVPGSGEGTNYRP